MNDNGSPQRKTRMEEQSRNHAHEPLPSKSYDPLEAARVEAGTFNRLWLKDGRSLSGLQRIGYGIFSTGFIAGGLFCADGSLESWQEGDIVWCFLWGLGTVFMLFLGGLGLRNILRFGRR
jgi:hypothetical protein